MAAPSHARLIKVKRKFGEDALPDLLVLDDQNERKRSRTELESRPVYVLYERVKEPADELIGAEATMPMALYSPSVVDTLTALSEFGTDDSPMEICYEFYTLQEDSAVLQAVDISVLGRIYLPEEELVHEHTEDEPSLVFSDEDSNAEDFYQNDYPDEDDSAGDGCYGSGSGSDDEHYARDRYCNSDLEYY